MTNWYLDTFSGLLVDVEQELKRFTAFQPRRTQLFWEMVDHHFGWDGEPAANGALNLNGKRTRPLLVMLVARALTGRYDHVLPAAIGIELVHNFTLVHDDVMDRSEERRHRQTLWARWGMAQAINAGDGLYALGMSALLGLSERGVSPERVLRAMDALLRACVDTVKGQMLDVSFEERLDVTPDEYLTMIAGKSGALIECSLRMGALLSTDDQEIIDAYGRFGINLGIAFQIWDDYLGIWGKAADMGKSATSDIEMKKKSYPVLIAFEQADAAGRDNLTRIYQQDTLSESDVSTVLSILEQVGAAKETHALIDTYFHHALDSLDSIPVQNDDQRHLRDLALFLVERAY